MRYMTRPPTLINGITCLPVERQYCRVAAAIPMCFAAPELLARSARSIIHPFSDFFGIRYYMLGMIICISKVFLGEDYRKVRSLSGTSLKAFFNVLASIVMS